MSLITQFQQWAYDKGIRSLVHPKESKGKGVGLFLSPKLLPRDADPELQGELLFVPQSLILSRSRILELPCQLLLKTFETLGPDTLTERLVHVLFLVFERSNLDLCVKGKEGDQDPCLQSLYRPYIATLPDICTPVTLDPELSQGYLAGTLLLDSVCAKRKRLESEYELLSGNLGVFEAWPHHPTLKDFIWADATFWSRALSFQSQSENDHRQSAPQPRKGIHQDDLHMVPFLDFANHAATPNIRWQVDPDGLRVWGNNLLQSNQNLQDQEQELFLSYGKKPNTELLFLYGFILQDNPTKVLTLAMPMDGDDPYYMPKAHTLMRLGVPPRITIYLDQADGPSDLVELCQGLWISQESQYLLWVYALNEEDGLGALMEEPAKKVCVPTNGQDDGTEVDEADLEDENTVGQLLMTIKEQKILTKDNLASIVPSLDIYPVLALRGLVFVTERAEFYISRIMETGDKVLKVQDVEIVRSVNYAAEDGQKAAGAMVEIDSDKKPSLVPRLGTDISESLAAVLSLVDGDDPVAEHQLEVEAQISSMVAVMKTYRTEEMDTLVHMSNLLGAAQTRCVESSSFIQEYLARMQV